MTDHLPRKEFRLPLRRPCGAVERARRADPRLRPGLPLDQADARIVKIADRPDRPEPESGSQLFVRRVAVIGEGVHHLARTGPEHVMEPFQAVGAERSPHDLRIGIAFLHGFRRRLDELAVFGSVRAVLPAPAAVRLVPDFKPGDAPLVAADGFHDITAPGLFLLLRLDGRTSDRAEHFRGILVIESVAVAEADPGNQSAHAEIVHDSVQPGEIVNALLLFRPRPAGLDADPFHAQFGDFVIRFFRLEDTAVQLLKTQSERRSSDL